jgi:cytochrome c-type biogenesis protein CcmF
MLRAEHRIDSLLSRDFTFLLNNWILLGMLVFVLTATTWPLISEAIRGQTVTVGPGFYNKWMVPLGLILMTLTGIGPLLAWRKSTGADLTRVLRTPLVAAASMMALHIAVGSHFGYPAFVEGEDIYDTMTGKVLAAIYGASPVMATTICTFVVAGHLQEFWRGTRVRMRNAGENAFLGLYELVTRAKRRHGGYIVHLGLVAMYFGFTGAAYDKDKESALRPGESFEVGGLSVRYDGSRMELDPSKRMVFADMSILEGGKLVARIAPAKFIYDKPQGTTTTEVAIRSTLKHDVYAIMNSINPETKVGTFRVIVRPFVAWIWIGGLFMMFGTAISMSPSVREVLGEARQRSPRASAAAAAMTALLLAVLGGAVVFALLSPALASAQNDASSSLHAGSVTMNNAVERQLFSRLLCECGDCQRLPLSSCACSVADDMRAQVRKQLSEGVSPAKIQSDYRARFGPKSIAIPSDQGMDRALWALPILAIGLMAIQIVRWGRRWRRKGQDDTASEGSGADSAGGRARYDAVLDRELDRMEEGA